MKINYEDVVAESILISHYNLGNYDILDARQKFRYDGHDHRL